MNVYIPGSAEGFEFCQPTNGDDFETLNLQVNGVSRCENWSPVPMELIGTDEGALLRESDSPWFGSHALIFRTDRLGELRELLLANGELLACGCSTANLSIFNPTVVVDALDEAQSSVMRFTDGRIMRVTSYAFHTNMLEGKEIFKIPSLRVSPTFVGEHFVRLWQEHGLRGLVFRKIWSSNA